MKIRPVGNITINTIFIVFTTLVITSTAYAQIKKIKYAPTMIGNSNRQVNNIKNNNTDYQYTRIGTYVEGVTAIGGTAVYINRTFDTNAAYHPVYQRHFNTQAENTLRKGLNELFAKNGQLSKKSTIIIFYQRNNFESINCCTEAMMRLLDNRFSNVHLDFHDYLPGDYLNIPRIAMYIAQGPAGVIYIYMPPLSRKLCLELQEKLMH